MRSSVSPFIIVKPGQASKLQRERRSARTKLARLRSTVVEFADWMLAPGHRPVAEVREWAEYLRDRARR